MVSILKTHTHTHRHVHTHVLECVTVFFPPAFCSLSISLSNAHTHTHTHHWGTTEPHTHWVFPLLFYCLSVTCNQSAAYPCCAVLPSSLKLEREFPLPTDHKTPPRDISKPANPTHTHTHTHTHTPHCLLRFYSFGNLAHQTKRGKLLGEGGLANKHLRLCLSPPSLVYAVLTSV